MSRKSQFSNGQPSLLIAADVARKIRQHARSSMKTEICGVLIGQDRPGRIEIQACIAGANADEAGAHVTFTQDTWEHIYQVKDKEYPDHRIVGWYHSHPGFGVFLSDHDTFIHKNFFASPGQVAWVFDPHSDEEGCFGWVGSKLERLSQIAVVDHRGGETVQESGRPEPSVSMQDQPEPQEFFPSASFASHEHQEVEESSEMSLLRLATSIFSYLSVLVLGFALCWYFFPRFVLIPVDPYTGKPLPGYTLDTTPENSSQSGSAADKSADKGTDKNNGSASQSPPSNGGAKENNAQPKR
jgi:proteasome lid subunit RPN8/RPN11